MLICAGLRAEGAVERMFSPEGELSSSLVNDVVQDAEGYVWIGTEYGLNRCDGHHIRTFHHNPREKGSIRNNYVQTLHVDSRGTLRVGFIDGMMSYNRGTNQFEEIILLNNKGQQVRANVVQLMEQPTGDLWIATASHGLYELKSGSDTARYDARRSEVIGTHQLSRLASDAKHPLWVGTENDGVNALYSAGAHSHYAPSEIGGAHVTDIKTDAGSGSVYVSTLEGNVAELKAGSERFRIMTPTPSRAAILQIYPIEGRLIVATDGEGLQEVTEQGFKPYQLPQLQERLEGAKIHRLTEDRDGNLWVALYQRGVLLVPHSRYAFQYFGAHQGENNPIGQGCVMAMAQNEAGQLWISCDGDGLWLFDPVSGEGKGHINIPATAVSLLSGNEGTLWAGTYGRGLWKVEGGKITEVPALERQRIFALAHAPGGKIYVGTLGNGLWIYDPRSGKATAVDLPQTNFAQNLITNLYTDSHGRLWISTFSGVSMYDAAGGVIRHFSSPTLDNAIAYNVAEGADGTMNIGTTRGLLRLSPDFTKLTVVGKEQGLPNEVVCGIATADDGTLWLSTYHGIARYDPTNGHIQTFDYGDGLQGNEFTHGALLQTDRGNICMGGTHGLSMFHPYDISKAQNASATPSLVELNVGSGPGSSRPVGDSGKVMLEPDERTFTLALSALTFDNPDKTTYQYRIPQLSTQWQQTTPGSNRITFNNLPSGHYTFQTRLPEGGTEATRTVEIYIAYPWYQRWWAWALYGFLVMAMICVGIHVWQQRRFERIESQRMRQAERLNQGKLQFLYNISHEIRTPLTLVIDPIKRLIEGAQKRLKDTSVPTEATEIKQRLQIYELMQRNAQRILRLVNELLDVRKLEQGQLHLSLTPVRLQPVLEEAVKPFEDLASEKHIRLELRMPTEAVVARADADSLDKVIVNLLSNAFKYTPADGEIAVTLTRREDKAQITVADTGIGIPPKDIERIFHRFYQVDNEVTHANFGTGIGLHLAQSLVELHGGTITAANRSDTPHGSIFTVTLPMVERMEEGVSVSGEKSVSEAVASVSAKEAPVAPEPLELHQLLQQPLRHNPRILVVEDDADIREYLSQELSDKYQVETAPNGRVALEQAIGPNAPDIIISDVMMPEIDGITLVKKLKQSIMTNHLPVILLSARNSAEDTRQGLEAGAEAYISKPFDSGVLRSNIATILRNRQRLRVKFSGGEEQADRVDDVKVTSPDDKLMERVMGVINAHMSSTDLTVELLAQEVGLSRVHLTRRLRELTNQSARDFIRNIRMRQAARLLREHQLTVTEIAYAVGFANPSHFTVAFKETFGMTPKQYAQGNG